jgi:hypothetical protein
MRHAIRVDSPFATPYRTAKVLGVSKSRTEALIKIAGRYTDRILKDQASKAGPSADNVNANGHASGKSSATVVRASVVRKSRTRHAGTKISSTKSKPSKARH